MEEEERWIKVYSASGMVEARIVAGRLETDGIETVLKYDAAGPIYGITVDGLGEVKIMVRRRDLSRALAVLSSPCDEGDLPWHEGDA
ncbi:MAG TPA: DUF2007 domain-containing protein [Syntrophales bacterium]|nr:DUF2007 domain-containing protein [Syntrophales bacterium]HOM07128.1 DUF2007 domain-containing protein [Syntrophales bacterium]HPC00428.1 DUF2007 domain-containing protein [Syntrophales bacterium]HPQ05511.1 DUF2007 domain-containing protein [Syntrophales bacterium]HRS87934.1 DUF2007 domain-containing protein [Syntrophales bacterium]